jgi:hypothetical protein
MMFPSNAGAVRDNWLPSPPVVFVARDGRVSWEHVRSEFDARAFLAQVEGVGVFVGAVAQALGQEVPTYHYNYSMSFRGLKDALVDLFGESSFYSDEAAHAAPLPVAAVVEGDPRLFAPPPPPPCAVAVKRHVAIVEGRPVPSVVEVCGQMIYKDVIYSILLHLEVPTLLVVARVCRLFALMAEEDNLWRRFNEGGASRQFLSGLYQLRAMGKVEFSFTGAEKRIYKSKCRDLFAAMGFSMTCLACKLTVRMTPAYWRSNSFVQFYHPEAQMVRFCCPGCSGTTTRCRCGASIACTEEGLRAAIRRYHNEVRCPKCLLTDRWDN